MGSGMMAATLRPPETASRIVTIRHAASTFSKQQKIAGRLDVPLSSEGIEESRRLHSARLLVDWDVVVSSPLSRALQTTRLVTGLPEGEIVVRADCIERDYGEMQGLEPEMIAALRPPIQYVKVGRYRHSLNPPSGEPFPDLRLRAQSFLEGVLNGFSRRTVLVFSHQTFLQQLHGVLLGMDEYECLELDIGHLEMNHFVLDQERCVSEHRCERWSEEADGSW